MKRFIYSDNGTIKDFSTELSDYHENSAVIDYTTAEDYLYIGSELPFNSLYFKVDSQNSIASSIKIEYWDGSNFIEMVEVKDETSVGGVPFSRSGHINWVPDKNYTWTDEDTVDTSDQENIDGLGSVTIYDLFWLRVSFSASLTVSTELSWLGPKFCTDNDLKGEYTMLANTTFINNYEVGKTTWERESILASEMCVESLIDMAVIYSGDQLLERGKLRDSCVSKVAEIVFNNLGDDYIDDTKKARLEYKSRIKKRSYRVDKNANGMLDKREKGLTVGGLHR